ncbi:hypothetical protein [Nocardiopsis sp. NRRL B-16309]|uniref:hypothetical protein n=1 Tax=Nocardiopsis sp. NRRL B-16309 TaxID=1519494 RepID=UPI0006AFAEEB|nr:hypothetical protein [Nocardiopsis sp. NRRL B-16309]KOX13848.1 hypothetical protein ADL05_17985 [Nocardiopsis sp. NRRL B-16309]
MTTRTHISQWTSGAGALALALITTGCLPGFPDRAETAPDPASEAPAGGAAEQVEETSEAQETQGDGGAVEAPADNSRFGSATWGVPVLEGWTIEVFDQNGVHQFTHDSSSCQVTLYRNRAAESSLSGGPRDTLDGFTTTLENEVGTVAVVPRRVVEVSDFGGGTAEFESDELGYTGNDGVDYTMLLAAQWFEDVELIMAPVCPTSDYGANAGEVDDFVGSLTVERV